MLGTYHRLGVTIYATDREVIKAARYRLRHENRDDPQFREGRKAFYKSMLHYHHEAFALAREFAL